jgi:hypothetical protein
MQLPLGWEGFSSYTNAFRQKLGIYQRLNSSLDVVITEKWYAEQLCFMWEKRKDLKINTDIFLLFHHSNFKSF